MNFNNCFRHLILLGLNSFEKMAKTVAQKFVLQCKSSMYKALVHLLHEPLEDSLNLFAPLFLPLLYLTGSSPHCCSLKKSQNGAKSQNSTKKSQNSTKKAKMVQKTKLVAWRRVSFFIEIDEESLHFFCRILSENDLYGVSVEINKLEKL